MERDQIVVRRLHGERLRNTGRCTFRPSACPWCTSRAPVCVSVATVSTFSAGRLDERCRTRLVVVLEEPQEAALVVVGEQVEPHLLLGALVEQPVVQPLVVAAVEALHLERGVRFEYASARNRKSGWVSCTAGMIVGQ